MLKTHLTRFIIVGITTQLSLLLIFWLAVALGVPPLLAVTATYILGTVASLLLNGRWTFQALNRETAVGSTFRFALLYALGYFYSVAAFWLLSLIGTPHVLDQFFVMVSCAGLTFMGQKYWVFRTRKALL